MVSVKVMIVVEAIATVVVVTITATQTTPAIVLSSASKPVVLSPASPSATVVVSRSVVAWLRLDVIIEASVLVIVVGY